MRDAVLWLGIAGCAGALFTSAPLAVALACLIVALMLKRKWLAVLCALLLFAGYVRARHVMRVFEEARDALITSAGWPAKCTVEGRVVASPVLLGSGLRVVTDAEDVRCPTGPPLRGRVTLYVPDTPDVARGDRVRALATIAPPYRFWNDADPRPSSARRGILLSGGADDLVVVDTGLGPGHLIDRVRSRLRARIVATFPADTAPMARALVLGEDDLDERDSRAFRKSGLAHLLAVSGMHLVLVVMGSVAAVRMLLVRIPPLGDRFDVGRLAAACGVPFAWLYADLAGGSGSAVRAAWMCSVVLLARAMGRHAEPWRALGLSLLAMSTVDPLIAFDLSFVLSMLATAGLLGLAPRIDEWLRAPRFGRRRLPSLVARPLATTLAATIACAPVLACIAPELALGGLLANLIAVPLGEAAALPLCLLHGLLELWPNAEHGCAIAASGALVLVRLVAHGFAWATIPVPAPTPGQLAAFAVAGAALALLERRRRVVIGALGMVVALEVVARLHGTPHGVLRATFIDVGQGDAALVDLPDGSAMLIDAGGLVGSPVDVGERAVGALLSARRRTRLAAVVLSHPHPDHFGGLASALARARVDEFWDTGQGEAEGSAGPYAAVLAEMRARQVPIVRPRELCGTRTLGGATIDVLAPCPGPVADRGANDNSFVIRIRYGRRALLFMGDAEHTEEAELSAADLRADVLKVGHHGSRTSSTPAFLARAQPAVAVISCGVRNRFGHPHASTLEHLAAMRVFRTDRDGAVVVETNGQDLSTTPMNGRLR
jgi:competence protein ComEC